MTRRYYRVGPAIWDEPWNDDTKLAAFYLLTCRHRTTEGLYRLPMEYARADMKWSSKRFDASFARLIKAGFIEHDAAAQVVLLVNALKWQTPANPNQVKAAVKAIRELPATPLLDRFRTLAATHAKALAKALGEPSGEPLAERLPQPLAEAVSNTPSPSPAPSPEIPPLPPKGGRSRSLATYRDHLVAYKAKHFPEIPTETLERAIEQACSTGAEVGRYYPLDADRGTTAAVAETLERYFSGAAA